MVGLSTRAICNFLFLTVFALSSPLIGQHIELNNPSFEDRAHFGAQNNQSDIKGWYDCGAINFPLASPPDIHQGVNRDTAFWDNTVATSHGKTYLGMVVRDNESWESVSQRLAMPLKAGKCYTFSIYLARSDTYNSQTMSNPLSSNKASFTEPTVLRIWGGNGYCSTSELIGESLPIDHSEWREYVFQVEPQMDYKVVTFEAFYKTPVLFPYNGHILLDNASAFKIVTCEENFEVFVRDRVAPKKKVKKKMPAHKAKAKKQRVMERGNKENVIDTIVYRRPKKENVLSLDRKKMKKGQTIRIDKLYFDANVANVNDESYDVLDEIFDFLKSNDDIKIAIEGHTNGKPDHSFCDSLSEARALAVAEYLISRGIDTDRLTSKGYGKRKAIASNKTPAGRAKNQRVEIKILSMGSQRGE